MNLKMINNWRKPVNLSKIVQLALVIIIIMILLIKTAWEWFPRYEQALCEGLTQGAKDEQGTYELIISFKENLKAPGLWLIFSSFFYIQPSAILIE